MKAHAVPDIRQIKGFAPRLVVHDPQIEPPVVLPAVHPVHEAGDADRHAVHTQLHRGQVLPRTEAQLEGNGLELGCAQLLRHVVHHGVHRFEQPPEQVAEAGGLVLHPAQLLADVPLHRRLGQGAQLLLRNLLHAPPLPAGPQHVLQHVVDEGAVLRGLEPGARPSGRTA